MYDWLHNFCSEREGWALLNRFNHTSGVTAVLKKPVRKRCVIEVFGGVFMLSHWFLDFSAGVGACVIWLSQISSFFSSFYIYRKLFLL